jgi:serine O-acetyltransferase
MCLLPPYLMSSNPAQTAPPPAQSGAGIETGAMVIEHGRDRLLALVERQLTNLFEYDPGADAGPLQAAMEITLNRVSHCFSRIVLKRYQQDGAARFSPFHSGQYCIFLYYLSHTLARQGASGLADRVYYLNRALNGVDLFHQVDLPEVFCVEHPLASVIGRAQIGDCFFFAQGVTVGGNKGAYPVIGRHVSMLSNSKVVGRSVIGDHVILSANCYVKDAEIPPHSIVFGQDRNLIIKNNPGGLTNDIFANDQA